jgi:hypothetical protein
MARTPAEEQVFVGTLVCIVLCSVITTQRYAAPETPWHVRLSVVVALVTSASIVALVPFDVYTVRPLPFVTAPEAAIGPQPRVEMMSFQHGFVSLHSPAHPDHSTGTREGSPSMTPLMSLIEPGVELLQTLQQVHAPLVPMFWSIAYW